MSEVLTTPEIKRALKPAKRWRNRWRAIWWNTCGSCRTVRQQGQVYWDCCDPAWPSLDVAETNARDQLAFQIENEGRALEEFRGAFPCEDA